MAINRNSTKGLTIIELLIVLGIILVLTGIGLENYLGASVRAKVSRVHSEFHTYLTGIESYRIDCNNVPRMAHYKFYGDPEYDFVQGTGVSGVMSKVLSTPIAYLSQAQLVDPFMVQKQSARFDERLYTYQVIPVYIERNNRSVFWPRALVFYGDWRMASVGPDETFDHLFINSAQLPYDATNGLISLGNIWHSQNNQQSNPPIPELLGKH